MVTPEQMGMKQTYNPQGGVAALKECGLNL
jgi:hypothetical protein